MRSTLIPFSSLRLHSVTAHSPPLYFPNGTLGALVCRDKLHLHVHGTSLNTARYTSNDIIANGSIEELYHSLLDYTSELGHTPFARALWDDFWVLAVSSVFPVTYQATNGLAGNVLAAASTIAEGTR